MKLRRSCCGPRGYAISPCTVHHRRGGLEWLSKPEQGPGNIAPLDLLDTDFGAREVENLLRALAYGQSLTCMRVFRIGGAVFTQTRKSLQRSGGRVRLAAGTAGRPIVTQQNLSRSPPWRFGPLKQPMTFHILRLSMRP